MSRARRSTSHAAISSLRLGVDGVLANSRRSASNICLKTSWPRRRGATVLFSTLRGARLRDRPKAGLEGFLEAAGVEFTNGDEPGVKLRKGKTNG
jgi:hypothetical protein